MMKKKRKKVTATHDVNITLDENELNDLIIGAMLKFDIGETLTIYWGSDTRIFKRIK